MTCLTAARKAVGSAPARESIYFTGLRAFFDQLLDNIAAAEKLNFSAILHVVQQTAARLEHNIARHEYQPQHISPQSRALLAWFRYFAEESALQRYVEAVKRCQTALMKMKSPRWREPLSVHFRPAQHLYHWRRLPAGTRVTLPVPMICFDDQLFHQLAQYMLRRRQPAATVTSAILKPDYRAIADRLDELGGSAEQTQGMVYDLADSFARVNRDYFCNQSPRPTLTWSHRVTRRKFGHYDLVRDVVMISRTLDHPDVPVFVLDHVMHHELLHKKHGFKATALRRCFHTPEFRAEERTFAQYGEADRILNQLAKRR